MMLALVLIVATDAAPAPVSAAPRSLSDYALEHRGVLRGARTEPGRGAGGFSAAESTIPREPYAFFPAFEREPQRDPPETATVEAPPVYGPVWWVPGGGGRAMSGRVRQRPRLPAAAPRRVRAGR